MLEAGVIGEPLTALTLFDASGPESWHPNPDFLYARGGGPLFDMGPYYLSTLVQLLGPVSGVVARASTATATRRIGSGPRAGETFPVEVPTHIGALIDFRRGTSAISTFSFQSSRPRVGVVEISGTEGTLVLPDPNGFEGTIHVWRAGMNEESEAEAYPAVGSTFSRGAGVVELARAIRAGRPERASGDVAYHVLDVMVSLSESAERGERVAVESTVEVPPALPEAWDPTRRDPVAAGQPGMRPGAGPAMTSNPESLRSTSTVRPRACRSSEPRPARRFVMVSSGSQSGSAGSTYSREPRRVRDRVQAQHHRDQPDDGGRRPRLGHVRPQVLDGERAVVARQARPQLRAGGWP